MIPLIRLQRDLFDWFKVLFSQCLHLAGKHLGRIDGGIDAVRLYGDHGMTTVFEEAMSVHSNNAGLIRLSDICKYNVDGGKQHAVSLRQSCVFHDCCKKVIKRAPEDIMKHEDSRITFVLRLAMLIRSRPDLSENSTA